MRGLPEEIGRPYVLPEDVSLLSLDVFDTALIRDVCQPDHVFCLVQRTLSRLGMPIRNFAKIRIDAERIARHAATNAHGFGEVTLDGIYRQLRTMTRLPDSLLETAKNAEIDAELECAHADKDILELYAQAVKAGIPVVFLSDMYLPESVIAQMLASQGYSGHFEVFASAGCQLTKTDGGLFKHILEAFDLPPSRMLHAGDDHQADVITPEGLGIRTIRHHHGRSNMRKVRSCSPAILPLSRLKAAHWSGLTARGEPAALLKYLGKVYGTVIHGAFTRWIVETAIANDVDLLLFFSRDGFILKKAYDIFRTRHEHLPPSAYCCVSRLTLRTAFMTCSNDADYEFLLSGLQPKPVSHVLRRCGISLTEAAEIELLASCSLTPDDIIVEHGENQEKAKDVLRLLEGPLRLVAVKQQAALDGYLRRFALDRFRRIAVIDLGWGGNLQRGFEQASARLGYIGRVLGLYFGLRGKAYLNRALGLEMAAFLPDLCSERLRPSLLNVVPLLELLHSAPHGGVSGYEFRDGSFRPLFAGNPLELKQYEEKLRVYHAAVLDSLQERALMDPAFSIDACREAVQDLCEHPSRQEAEILGDLVHFDGFEHNSGGLPIAPAVSPDSSEETIQTAYERAYWKSGFLARNEGVFPLPASDFTEMK